MQIRKQQAIPMKAAAGNHQILRLPIVSQRPFRVLAKFSIPKFSEWQLFGKQS
jgi:hypothetical protein